jgi:hypothetical protein
MCPSFRFADEAKHKQYLKEILKPKLEELMRRAAERAGPIDPEQLARDIEEARKEYHAEQL